MFFVNITTMNITRYTTRYGQPAEEEAAPATVVPVTVTTPAPPAPETPAAPHPIP